MLLVDIARKGNGSFSFIPDSGFVGTVLVHALASAATTVGQGAVLNLTAQNGAQVRMAFGDSYDHKPEKAASVSVKLDSLYYGQARKVLVAVSLPPDSRIEDLGEYLTAQLEYTNVNCETSIVAAKASTAVLGPLVDMDKEAGETLLRQKFVHLLSELIAARSDGASNRKNLPERAQERVQDFLDKNAGQHRGHGILVDTDSQVKLAVSQTDFWSRWGMNYVCSLLTAHKQQRCNNFKDKSVEGYGGKLFREERDRTDDIFRYKSTCFTGTPVLALLVYTTTNSDASCSAATFLPQHRRGASKMRLEEEEEVVAQLLLRRSSLPIFSTMPTTAASTATVS